MLVERVGVSFELPLWPQHRFTDRALAQLAHRVVGTEITLATMGGKASGIVVGEVQTARPDAGTVVCTALVDEALVDLIGGYGVDAVIEHAPGRPRWVGAVKRVVVVAISTSMLPSGARRPVRVST